MVIDRTRHLPYPTSRAEGRMAAPIWGGKSGLPEAMVPGNARAGQPDGKRHREQTAPISVGVRVKRWGKSPPGGWQQSPHGKPHREQCRIGGSRRVSAGSLQPRSPGWQHEADGNIGPRGMVIYPWGNPRGTESGLQALRAFFVAVLTTKSRKKG